MVCHPATKRERNEREKSVPNKPYPVEISTEVMRKHGTHISPHKPILCWDLYGRGACFAVTVPMDHPSRGRHFPPQVDSVHGDTVLYGWGKRQMGYTSFHQRNHPTRNMVGTRERIWREWMQPAIWKPPVTLTQQEEHIVTKIRKAKLFVFLRHHRHELFDEAFQEELARLYRPAERAQ